MMFPAVAGESVVRRLTSDLASYRQILETGFAKNFLHSEIKEILGIDRPQDQSGICSSARAPYGDDVLISAC